MLSSSTRYHDVVNFTLPGARPDARWRLLIDTNLDERLRASTSSRATSIR